MNANLLKIMKEDMVRCEDAQVSKNGSYALYQALIARYNSVFKGFENDIPKIGKASAIGEEFDYRRELNAIKEKLEINFQMESDNDPLFDFKIMYDEDLTALKKAISDCNNSESPESAKLQLYKNITAKYHSYVPKLGDGLYQYIPNNGFYDDVSGDSLFHNLNQIYNKLQSFKALGYPALKDTIPNTTSPVVQINNTNENKIDITISFKEVRKTVENMTSLQDTEIDEILTKIDDLEKIIYSKDRKTKKWDNAKDIIHWIADKGVDVGIALLPLLLQIK